MVQPPPGGLSSSSTGGGSVWSPPMSSIPSAPTLSSCSPDAKSARRCTRTHRQRHSTRHVCHQRQASSYGSSLPACLPASDLLPAVIDVQAVEGGGVLGHDLGRLPDEQVAAVGAGRLRHRTGRRRVRTSVRERLQPTKTVLWLACQCRLAGWLLLPLTCPPTDQIADTSVVYRLTPPSRHSGRPAWCMPPPKSRLALAPLSSFTSSATRCSCCSSDSARTTLTATDSSMCPLIQQKFVLYATKLGWREGADGTHLLLVLLLLLLAGALQLPSALAAHGTASKMIRQTAPLVKWDRRSQKDEPLGRLTHMYFLHVTVVPVENQGMWLSGWM